MAVLLSGPLLRLAGSPNWVLVCWAFALGFLLLVAVFGFVYFMFKDPDMLRSERFSLEKMAIEKGLYGDNIQGQIAFDSLVKALKKLDHRK